MKYNQEDLKQQWLEALGHGWPCEVFGRGDNRLLYFFRHDEHGFYFGLHPDDEWGEYYKEYRPLSMPLDFMYEREKKIEIHQSGIWRSIDEYGAPGNWKPWPNCPEGLKGKTLAIPDDWRPK